MSEHSHDAPHTHEHSHGDVSHSHPHTGHDHGHLEHEHQHAQEGVDHSHPRVHQAGLEDIHDDGWSPAAARGTDRLDDQRSRTSYGA